MKILLILFAIICGSSNGYLYWEDVDKEIQNKVIDNPEINRDIKNLYLGKISLRDDDKSLLILENLSSLPENDTIRAFYFEVFNRQCRLADGAVAESLSDFCYKLVKESPCYTLEYFKRDKAIMNLYASMIGETLYFAKKVDDYSSILDERILSLKSFQEYIIFSCDNMDEEIRASFFDLLQASINNMN